MKGAFLYLGMLAVTAGACAWETYKPRASEADVHKATVEGCMLIAAQTGNDTDLCLVDPAATVHAIFGDK
jgi:hypothetical protein